MSARVEPNRWLRMLLVSCALAAAYLYLLGLRPLMSPDEGRYAEISREMAASGNWVTPHLNGYLYFEKPPLQYWATAVAFTLFGVHEWSARLWNALMYLGAGLAVAWCAARLYGMFAAELSALVYFSLGLPFVLGQVDTLDPGVSAFLTLSLCAFAVAHRADAGVRERRTAMLLCWAGMGGATLSKGLIGIVLPGVSLGLYILVTRQWRMLARLQWLAGLSLLAAIVAPWFVLVSRRNPGFAHFFFIHEHFERYLTTVHDRIEPWWYFIVVVVLGSLPWTPVAVASLQAAFTQRGAAFRARLFFAIWIAFIVVFFSLSQSKLIGYVLPVFPALALLVGERLSTSAARGFRVTVAIAGLWWVACLIAGFAAGNAMLQRFSAADIIWIQTGLCAAALVGIVAMFVAWRLFAAGKTMTAWRFFSIAQIVATTGLLAAATPYADTRSSRSMIAAAPAEFSAATDVYSIGELDQSLPFYLRRPVTLVDFVNEFEYGMTAEPAKTSLSLQSFAQHWMASRHPVAVIARDRIAAVDALHLPASIVFADRHGAVMVRP